jgi:hypothetical protein
MKYIFVASSTEAKAHAEKLCDVLRTPKIEPLMWEQFFKPGYVPLEAIKSVTKKCSGAIVVASPDDRGVIRDREVALPRANVMLELGLLSAAFGRGSIALCRFDDVELPTDLQGFTYVALGKFKHCESKGEVLLENRTMDVLGEWAASLQDTIDDVPRTNLVHGYSGKWKIKLTFTKWRHIEITERSYANVYGHLQLHIPAHGQKGEGIAHGEMAVCLVDPTGAKAEYLATLRVVDVVLDVRCGSDASLQFVSQTFVRHVMEQTGQPWTEQITTSIFPAANVFKWNLHPLEAARCSLAGDYRTDDGRSIATVLAEKV